MNGSPELVALLQREREHDIEHDRLARIASCARCTPSLLDRVTRMLRPGTYPVMGGDCTC